jgi:hypothetical protein
LIKAFVLDAPKARPSELPCESVIGINLFFSEKKINFSHRSYAIDYKIQADFAALIE